MECSSIASYSILYTRFVFSAAAAAALGRGQQREKQHGQLLLHCNQQQHATEYVVGCHWHRCGWCRQQHYQQQSATTAATLFRCYHTIFVDLVGVISNSTSQTLAEIQKQRTLQVTATHATILLQYTSCCCNSTATGKQLPSTNNTQLGGGVNSPPPPRISEDWSKCQPSDGIAGVIIIIEEQSTGWNWNRTTDDVISSCVNNTHSAIRIFEISFY